MKRTARAPGPPLARLRLWRAAAVPLVLALPPLWWTADATRRASLTTLGRDQGIFQFIAWALSRGAVDYRDVRDVNGPLVHLVHLVFLALGGSDEHRFRLLDLAVTGASFAIAGACVPSIGSNRRPKALERGLWALAGWVVLSGQYLLYGFWDIAQRESFLDWFLLPALALQLAAQRPCAMVRYRRTSACAARSRGPVAAPSWAALGAPRRPRRLRVALFVLMGMLSVLPWFGKPTYVLFTAAQLLALFADRRSPVPRAKAFAAFCAGAAAAGAAQVVFLVRYGDPGAYGRILLLDVPSMYRFMWIRSPSDILSTPFFGAQALLAVAVGSASLALVASGAMPARSLGVALAPGCALGSVLVQAKGFPYHFHPVTATIALAGLVFVSWLSDRTRVARRRRALVRVVPVAVAAAFSVHAAGAVLDSPYLRDPWLLGAAARDRSSPEYFGHFVRSDFFPDEMREAAAFVGAHTRPGDSVQTYGMDPYVLFLADRMSATPYIYAYELNADAAMAGGTGGRPDAAQIERIVALRDAHEADLLRRIRASPPAAFIFIDGSPLLSQEDAWQDFAAHCPRAAPWVAGHYREAARFGHDHVWLRLSSSAAALPGPGS